MENEKERGAKYSISGGTLIVGLPGEVDDYWCGGIRQEMTEYLHKRKFQRIVFDFSNTHFMDSSGIGLLLHFYKNFNGQGGEILLCGEDVRMEKILRMSGIYQIMNHTGKKC